jgi:hypothetical protein
MPLDSLCIHLLTLVHQQAPFVIATSPLNSIVCQSNFISQLLEGIIEGVKITRNHQRHVMQHIYIVLPFHCIGCVVQPMDQLNSLHLCSVKQL